MSTTTGNVPPRSGRARNAGMPPGHMMSSLRTASAIDPSRSNRHQRNCLIHAHYPRHAWEHPVHEEVVVGAPRRIAGIAHHHDTVVEIARREHGARDADIGRAAGDDDRIDAPHLELKVEMGLKERAPALLWDE